MFHRRLGAILLAILVAFVCIGDGAKNARGQGKGGEVIKTTSEAFVKEFKKNSIAMGKKHAGATFELTGTIERSTKHFAGKGVIEMKTNERFVVLSCFTKEPQPWTKFTAGQQVKIVGTYPKSLVVVATLVDCVVEPITKAAIITVSAEQLSKEALAGFKVMEAKYKNHTIILTGSVVEAKAEMGKDSTVKLKGTTGKIVECRFYPGEKEFVAGLKVDQVITIAAEYGYTDSTTKEVQVSACIPVAK